MGKVCKFKDFHKLQKELKLSEEGMDEFMNSLSKEIAARLLRKAMKRTPVRDPKDCPKGITGGTLKRGWTVGETEKRGNTYQIEVENPVEYASYVEFGHRTRNHRRWIKGEFMLTIAEQEIQSNLSSIVENKIKKMIKI